MVLYILLIKTSPKNALCKVWLKLGQWFCRRRYLYFHNEFFANLLLSSLGNAEMMKKGKKLPDMMFCRYDRNQSIYWKVSNFIRQHPPPPPFPA